MLDRLEILIKDKVNDIKNKTILVVGVGGVGGYVVETLVRSGVGTLIIVDNDVVDISNLNRQIISLRSNIGQKKVDVIEKRMKDINPECNVIKYDLFLTKENTRSIFDRHIDYVVDACDTMDVKKELIRITNELNIKLIASMGTGNKLNPKKLEIMDLRKTSYDPIAKILRKYVKEERINKKIPVVSSTEQPIKTNTTVIGSTSFVPASAGLLITSYIINDIVGEV